MSQPKDSQRFAEIEYCLQHYFSGKLTPVMKEVRDDLNTKQCKELADYQRSPAGILASCQTSMAASPFDAISVVKMTGEWNSKTTEEYLEMCNRKIQESTSIQKDLTTLAEEWRGAAVKKIGSSQYEALSQQIGGDLAYAYVGLRMEELMTRQLVRENMPKSSAEYILKKASRQSIWGLANELRKSPLEQEIEMRSEKAYQPNDWEKGAGMALGIGVDALSLGGAGTWKNFASVAGSDLAFSCLLGETGSRNSEEERVKIVENSISREVFGSEKNAFADIRKNANRLNASESDAIRTINSKLSHKIFISNPDFTIIPWNKMDSQKNEFPLKEITQSKQEADRDEKHKSVPLVIAPGQEAAYLEDKARQDAVDAKAEKSIQAEEQMKGTEAEAAGAQGYAPEQAGMTNSNGWAGLLSTVGLNGIGDIGTNLGYVISMLPDILVGLFTGKTKSLNLGDNLMPIASIVAGMFVKNPMLKTVLIGMGGMNLLNKAGHEAMEVKHEGGKGVNSGNRRVTDVPYKTYPDESLNARISGPVLQGNYLVATIDRVPCSIQLTEHVVKAYHAGALPLNTLANAIVAKNDQMRQLAELNYSEAENETVHRTRGIQ